MPVTLFTIGHSTRPLEELIEMLREAGVELLVDVRRFPGSRRNPQYGQHALALSLAEIGITYEHAIDLGGRRTAVSDSPNTAWRNAAFRGYADYAQTQPFQKALSALLTRAERTATAVMCAEALPQRCHRRLIADYASSRGFHVRHLLAPRRTEDHELHPQARALPDGRLVYEAGAVSA